MNTRMTVSGDSSIMTNGALTTNGGAVSTDSNANGAYNGGVSQHERPTSAPGGRLANSISTNLKDYTNEDSDMELARRRPKSLMQRSKSDFGPRSDDSDAQNHDSDNHDWGARHGFEDHYASEEYVSQLANVSGFHFVLSKSNTKKRIELVHVFYR